MRRQSARHRCCGQVPQGTANLRFPSANLYLLQDFERFIDQASEDQLNELALAYEEIRRREDSSRISRWIDDCAANRNDKSYKALGILRTWFVFCGRRRQSSSQHQNRISHEANELLPVHGLGPPPLNRVSRVFLGNGSR